MTVGERIKQKRLELGLTQDELAKKAGYKSRSSINKIECSRDLPLSKVKKVASLLECSPSYLMGWEDDNVLMEIEKADEDFKLIMAEKRYKEYFEKFLNLSDKGKEYVMVSIDMAMESEGK